MSYGVTHGRSVARIEELVIARQAQQLRVLEERMRLVRDALLVDRDAVALSIARRACEEIKH